MCSIILRLEMSMTDFSPYVTTVQNSPLEPRLKEFILNCFLCSKTGTELDARKLMASINMTQLPDRPVIKTYLSVLFNVK